MNSFEKMFKEITPEEIEDDVFTLVGKVLSVVTAGDREHYNSMVASGGGMGVLFRKPATWCIFQSGRYTLELIEKYKKYTLCYFPDEYKEKIMIFAKGSGRDCDKMKEVELEAIETPGGNMAYEEARLIIECELTQVTAPDINDFRTEEARGYIEEAMKDPIEQRKYVFGDITHVWVKRLGNVD